MMANHVNDQRQRQSDESSPLVFPYHLVSCPQSVTSECMILGSLHVHHQSAEE